VPGGLAFVARPWEPPSWTGSRTRDVARPTRERGNGVRADSRPPPRPRAASAGSADVLDHPGRPAYRRGRRHPAAARLPRHGDRWPCSSLPQSPPLGRRTERPPSPSSCSRGARGTRRLSTRCCRWCTRSCASRRGARCAVRESGTRSGVSSATVGHEWAVARLWLRRELDR
jgi:hypothetical protein